jgi:SAM-dependent methyltransferase
MTTTTIIDSINLLEMSKASSVHHYSNNGDLNKAERAALARVAEEVRGRRIVDIGVGGGRTVRPLRELSHDYLGIDNSHAMVAACRLRFGGVDFRHADARAMSDVPEGSVRMAMFSCNGIGMVSHEDRLKIMREVLRVLEPGGLFLFSTHNQNCPDHTAGFKLPALAFSPNPLRMAARLARFSWRTALRYARRRRFVAHEVRTSEYSIINDVCHDYGVMLYYILLSSQRRQLVEMGFSPEITAFDLSGHEVHDDGSPDSSLMLIARKPM